MYANAGVVVAQAVVVGLAPQVYIYIPTYDDMYKQNVHIMHYQFGKFLSEDKDKYSR
jgi:hypothetical protein